MTVYVDGSWEGWSGDTIVRLTDGPCGAKTVSNVKMLVKGMRRPIRIRTRSSYATPLRSPTVVGLATSQRDLSRPAIGNCKSADEGLLTWLAARRMPLESWNRPVVGGHR
jgi:hypothetical protein